MFDKMKSKVNPLEWRINFKKRVFATMPLPKLSKVTNLVEYSVAPKAFLNIFFGPYQNHHFFFQAQTSRGDRDIAFYGYEHWDAFACVSPLFASSLLLHLSPHSMLKSFKKRF